MTEGLGSAASEAAWNWLLLGEWLIAIGILAMAGGILWTVVQNRRIIRAESTPNLILSDFEFVKQGGNAYTLELRAVNLGRFPIYLRALHYWTDTMHSAATDPLDVLIPPSESCKVGHTFDTFTTTEEGKLRFEFQYGATGAQVHVLEFPLELSKRNHPIVQTQGSDVRSAVT